MILIIGGAYNGKLQYVKDKFNIEESEIYNCNDDKIDLSKKVINGLHKFTYNNAVKDIKTEQYIIDNINLLKDKIIICDEINCGIVPIQKEERMWREDTGKVLQILTKECTKVYRIFSGIDMVLKDE